MNYRQSMQLCIALIVVCLMATLTFAQTLTGSISGVVSDANGANVVGATVTITNVETGLAVFTGTTDEAGLYNAPSLPLGTYDVVVEASGFKRVEVNQVQLSVGQRARIDAALETGQVTDTVTITGDTVAQLERDSSSQDTVIDTNQIRDLPTFDRNPLNLVNLVPGVSSGGDGTTVNDQQISINGSRTSNNEVTVDGLSVTQGGTGRPAALPSSEALREFRVLTSAYSAEYGRTSGGFISAVFDSGGRRFRGRVYEFFRNEKLNANNFFRNARSQSRLKDRYNLYGVRFDGPLFLPNFGEGGPVFNTNRDRTYFLVNYEGLRRLIPASPTSNVPTAALRNGDFNGTGVLIRDPLRTGLCQNTPSTPVAGVNYQEACFPGNVIPANRVDPAARQILSFLPNPNVVNVASAGAFNNYFFDQSLDNRKEEFNARVDHNFNSDARMFVRFTYRDAFAQSAQNIPGILGGNPGDVSTLNYQAAIGYTQSLTPNLLFEFNGGYVREDFQQVPPSEGINPSQLFGIANTTRDVAPRIDASYFSIGTAANAKQDQITNTYQGQASLSYVRGNNTLKFGGQYRLSEFGVFFPQNNYAGQYTFNGTYTATGRRADGFFNGAAQTGSALQAYADFLLGLPRTGSYSLPIPPITRRGNYYALYVQDDLKITPRLTVNVGLRYDLETPLYVRNNLYSRVDPFTGRLLVATNDKSLIGRDVTIQDVLRTIPASQLAPGATDPSRLIPNNPATGTPFIAGQYSDKYLGLKTDRNNFGPRVGVAYSLNDKTVIRSAFGIFYSPLFVNLGASANFTGFTVENIFQNGLNDVNSGGSILPCPLQVDRTARCSPANPLGSQPITLSQGYPLNVTQDLSNPFRYLLVPNSAGLLEPRGITNPLNQTGLTFAEASPSPYTMQFNLGIQRQVFGGIILDASYVGSRSRHQPLQIYANAIPISGAQILQTTGNTVQNRQNLRANPYLDNVFAVFNAGSSNYDSLQLQANRNFARSYSFNVAYTFSKAIDDGSGLFNGTQINGVAPNRNINANARLERALSTFDRPHIFSASSQITTNIGPRFLRNFIINPIVIARSGSPLNIAQNAFGAQGSVLFQVRPSLRNGQSLESLYANSPVLPEGGIGIQYLTPAVLPPVSGTLSNTNPRRVNPDFPFQPTLLEYPTVARNIARGPGLFQVNLGVGRNFQFSERLRVQLRGEMFNLFNRTNFSNPNTALSGVISDPNAPGGFRFDAPAFGVITGTNSPRFTQLVLRVDF